MKEKLVSASVYVLIFVMIGSIAFIFGLLSSKLEKEVVYKDRVVESAPGLCVPTIKEKIVYREKIIYRGRVMTPIIIKKGKEKIIYKDTPEKIHYGVSLIGGYSDSTIKESVLGMGLKLRYKNYYGQTEFTTNHIILLSVGYEF